MKIVKKNWILSNLKSSLQTTSSVSSTVKSIIEDVKKNGDKSVLKYVQKFENSKATIKNIKLSKQVLKNAYNSISKKDREALKLAYKRIHYYHTKQRKTSYSYKDQLDTSLCSMESIEKVDFTSRSWHLVSTVLMTAIPALIAKVPNIMMCVPSKMEKHLT